MKPKIRSTLVDSFPPLGWIAMARMSSDSVLVLHGKGVESCDNYVVEGIWAGPFAQADFHRNPNFFGSGLRIDADILYFVPSSASVDRLFFCEYRDKIYVSNSLVILLANFGATLDRSHDYRNEANTILGGLDSYTKEFPVLHPEISNFYQVFCENIVIRGGQISFERRESAKSFRSFEEYVDALNDVLDELRKNYISNERSNSLDVFSTLSTGYDSTAVSTLVKNVGVTRCFSYTGSWSGRSLGKEQFDASPIASTLGLSLISLDADLEIDKLDELHLYAASPAGAQLPLLAMGSYIKDHGSLAVVFTGYHGDGVWDVDISERVLSSPCARKDVSGLDLSQLRLECGFINVPVPFIYADQVRAIARISQQDEMRPWRLFNDYDRPIPRRIVEGSGVERPMFGNSKAAIYTRRSKPQGKELRRRYFRSLRDELGIPVPLILTCAAVDRLCFRLLKTAISLLPRNGQLAVIRAKLLSRRERLGEGDSLVLRGLNLRLSLYRWSVHVLSRQLEPDFEQLRVKLS